MKNTITQTLKIWKRLNTLAKPFILLVLLAGMQQAYSQTNIQVTNLTVSDPTPSEGQTITYTVTMRNNGPQATTALKILDVLPAGLTYVSSTPQQGTYTPATGIWDLGILASGQNRGLDIVATVNAGTSGTTIANTAVYSSSTPADNNATDNSFSVNITVNRPDILVTKVVSNAAPNEGENITFTVTARNLGSQDATATGLVVTDFLPAGLTYVSHVAPGVTTYNPGTGAWNIGTMIDNAGAITLTIVATVNAGQSGNTITNTASVTAINQPEETLQASTASASVIVDQPDIIVTKAVNNAAPNVGGTIVYTVTAKNIGVGDAPATGLVITDLLPAGLTYVSSTVSAGTTYTPGSGLWNIGTLLDNVTVTLTITATVNAGQTGATITNTASVSSINQTEPSTANNSASAAITVDFPDILITKTVSNAPYNENTNLTYTITVKNNGPAPATNVVVKDQLASILTHVSSSATQGTYVPGTGLWTVGSLASGVSRVLTITVFPNTGSSGLAINNTAFLNSMTENDPITANNTASVEIVVSKVDLLLEKSVNDNTPDVGQTITFSLKLSNIGPGVGTNIVIKDVLPAGLNFVAITSTPAGTTATQSGGTITWNNPTISSGANRTLQFTATVAAGYGARTITNTAYVESFQQVDPVLSNNTSALPFTVNGADLSITKTVSNTAPSTGSAITYTITVTNNGPLAGNDVQISDVLPAGVSFVSATADESSYTASTGIWGGSNLDLVVGETRTLTINATVTATNGNLVNNTATITTQTAQDGITANNTASAFFVVGNADVALTKSVNGSVFSPGNTVVYTLTLRNNGPFQAAGFSVQDVLPAGITFVSSSATLGSYNSVSGLWTFGTSTLANGATATLTINATVNANTAGFTIINNANAISVQGGNNTANDNASATFKVAGADIAVTKTASATTPTQGDPLSYTITVTNNGPNATTGLIIKDFLPNNLSFVSFTASVGSYSNVTGEWNIGNLANAATATLTINTTITNGGGITNTAFVLSSGVADNVTANNTASVFTSALKSFAAGACIIDMGVNPQTANSGLRPYGLVYQLVTVLKIPVYWAINPGKTFVSPPSKIDQADFTVAGKTYYGGAFIIPAEFVSLAQSTINSWVGLYPGLTVDCNRPAFTAPIHDIITSFPRAVLDAQNGDKAITAFYGPSGVPATSYRADGSPSNLTSCDDIYVLPHADPQLWVPAEKTILNNFILGGGWLFTACHATSALESLVDLNGDGIGDLNYLSNAGLVPWGSHGNGTLPPGYYYSTGRGQYAASVASDPFMQFLGRFDGALQNGSEQINIPKAAGWRSSTTVAVWDHDQPEVVSGKYPPGPAAALSYGRAFGNPSYGMIMEFTSHTFNGGTVAENTAAGRTFGNFLLQSGIEFKPKIGTSGAPVSLNSGELGSFTMNVAGTGPFTYSWTSSVGGTFSAPSSANTDFTAPAVNKAVTAIITLTVTDQCGRYNFESFAIPIFPPSTNPDLNSTFVNVAVPGNVSTNDNVPAGTTYGTSPTLLSSPAGSVATLTMSSNGTYSFTANTPGVYTYDVQVCVPGQVAPCPATKLVITVLNANSNTNAPVANADVATTNLNTPVTLRTLANDAAGNATTALVPSSVTVTVAPTRGTATVDAATGDITYTPNAGFSGRDTLTYQVCDNQTPAKCATAVQIITVNPAGTPNTTTAADDYKVTSINTVATGNVKTNDSDAEGNIQTVTAQTTTIAGKGTLVLNADGSYTFTPVTGFTGPVDFVYTTCDNGVPQACASATLHILVRGTGSIGDFVFNDANGNGLQDAGEAGIAGVTVTISSATNGVSATTTTDANGNYTFANLAPGTDYVVSFTTPAGFTATTANVGANDAIDSNPVGGVVTGVTIAAGTTNNTIDAGFYQAVSLGNTVFYDANNDGIKQATEVGIAGATVNLYAAGNTTAVIRSTTTDASGIYSFSGLIPGSYVVGVVLPSGYAQGSVAVADPNTDIDNDNNGASTVVTAGVTEVRSGAITLISGTEPDGTGATNTNTNNTLDFGLRGTSVIGDFVFNDANRNGLQDAGELGLPNVTVTLTYPDGSTRTILTDANGAYSFENLAPGTGYSIAFTTPINYAPSPSNVGSDASVDSNPINGVVSNITLAPNQIDNSIDAGFYQTISITGNVWHDVNGMTDNLVNNSGAAATPQAAAIPVGLRAYLVNNATGLVEKIAFVSSATNTFTFGNVTPNTNYFIILSNTQALVGNPPPAASLPTGWQNTGEKLGTGTGSDGIINGRLNVPVGTINVTNANFGIKLKSGEAVIG